jgi:division protein CdvB (Snf7/Vps24/ESCRT-III family)
MTKPTQQAPEMAELSKQLALVEMRAKIAEGHARLGEAQAKVRESHLRLKRADKELATLT